MGERRSDTREKIRAVALELFAEQGYEQTSLREIAERLGVTKAALYYHFKTKEDIVTDLFQDVQAEVERVLAWAREQSPTPEVRQEIVRRYAEVMRGPGGQLMRFMAENGPAVRDLKASTEARDRFSCLARMLSDEDAPLADQLRARLSIFCLHMTGYLLRDMDLTDEQRTDVGLQVALDLVSSAQCAPAAAHSTDR